MNFVLISPRVGADAELMPKTRPGRMTTGTSVSTPTPCRHVHRPLLPHRHNPSFALDFFDSSRDISSSWRGERVTLFFSPLGGNSFLYSLYRFPASTISFPISNQRPLLLPLTQLSTLSQQQYRNAAGCGHWKRLTTNHRLSATAIDMSLLSISELGATNRDSSHSFRAST